MSQIGYRPEIDGLRACAVAVVVFFHMGVDWIPGGYVGVDVFFVISGFLITSIIIQELELGTFSFRRFWARRIGRILPALFLVTAATLSVTFIFVFPLHQQVIGKQSLSALASVANIFFWQNTGDYWGSASERSPFLHAWSLSIEEQFYLIYPAAVWLVYQVRSRWLPIVLGVLTAGSMILFLRGSETHPVATFYLLPFRVWELGTGCLLAVALRNSLPAFSRSGTVACIGLVLILMTCLLLERPNSGLILAVLGTALVIAFGHTGACHTILSQPPLVYTGRISYSLYLWHWPLIVLAPSLGLDWPGVSDKLLLGSIACLLSIGSYHLVEKPIRRKTGIVPATLTIGILVAGGAIAMVLVPRVHSNAQFEVPRWIEYSCRPNWAPPRGPLFANVFVDNPNYRPNAMSSGEGIRIGEFADTPQIVVLGDSHGTMWSDAIADVVEELQIPASLLIVACGEDPFFAIPPKLESRERYGILTPQEKLTFDRVRLQAIENWKPRLVVIAARWHSGHYSKSSDLLKFLSNHRIQVLLIEGPPVLTTGEVNVMQYLAWQDLLPRKVQGGHSVFVPYIPLKDNESERAVVRQLAAAYANVEYLPTYDLYATDQGARVTNGRTPLYLDDNHLTSQGAKIANDRLRRAIQACMSLPQ